MDPSGNVCVLSRCTRESSPLDSTARRGWVPVHDHKHILTGITQVLTNTTTSNATFSILSPDASLSYDRIKIRLDEYRILLESDSDTIELLTENGKTVLCRKEAINWNTFLIRLKHCCMIFPNVGITCAVHTHSTSKYVVFGEARYKHVKLQGINGPTYISY